MKYWVQLFYFLCICSTQCFVVGEKKSINDNISEEIYSCDYTRFETQLEQIKLQAAINHETQLQQQKQLFGNLERKINDLSSKIDGIHDKLIETIKGNTDSLKDFIRAEYQSQIVSVTPAVDDKIVIMIDIKEKLKQHDEILNKIINSQNDTQQLIHGIDLEDHSQTLKSTIADNLISLKKIEEKVKAIEENSIPKIDQLKFYHDIQDQLNATEIYLRDGYHKLPPLSSINQSYPTSCADFNVNYCSINKCLIKNPLYGPAPFSVACENSVDGGGWTVIQRRINGVVDFYRGWLDYKTGFGDIDAEFFIGLDKLHAITSTLKPVELLIQLTDFNNVMKHAKYDDFQVANETSYYELIEVGSYTGDAGDSFSWHKNLPFSTKDRDIDTDIGSCAQARTGAWWYGRCFWSNLNSKYYHDPTNISSKNGISWQTFHGDQYSLKSVQMLIRPRK